MATLTNEMQSMCDIVFEMPGSTVSSKCFLVFVGLIEKKGKRVFGRTMYDIRYIA